MPFIFTQRALFTGKIEDGRSIPSFEMVIKLNKDIEYRIVGVVIEKKKRYR